MVWASSSRVENLHVLYHIHISTVETCDIQTGTTNIKLPKQEALWYLKKIPKSQRTAFSVTARFFINIDNVYRHIFLHLFAPLIDTLTISPFFLHHLSLSIFPFHSLAHTHSLPRSLCLARCLFPSRALFLALSLRVCPRPQARNIVSIIRLNQFLGLFSICTRTSVN